MKKSLFLIFLFLQLFLFNAAGSENAKQNFYSFLIPDYFRGQFAGNIGYISIGAGKDFFKGRLSGDLLLGYVPKAIANKSITTIILKNTIQGQNFRIKKLSKMYPLIGFSINYETGNNSFLKPPGRYPEGYYGTNAFTYSFFFGLAYQGEIYENSFFKQLEFYAEIGTLATYIYYNYKRRKYFNPDIWSLALGVKIKIN